MSVFIRTGILFGQADDRPLLLDIAQPDPLPAGPLPAVIHIHGGGWEAGNREVNPDAILPNHGFVYASIDYRLSSEAVFPAQIHDCKAAVRWLRAHAEEYHVDPAQIGVWGHSAGGHLAALLGASGDTSWLEGELGSPGYASHVQAVFAVSAPADFLAEDYVARDDTYGAEARMLGGSVRRCREVAHLASPIYAVTSSSPPIFLVHGAQDETVPVTQSRHFYAALANAGVDATYVEIARAPHDLESYWPDVLGMMLQFFRKHLVHGFSGKV